MKVLVAGMAAFVAGVGGALLAVDIGTARPSSYSALLGLVWLAVLVTQGIRSTVGALLAGVTFTILPRSRRCTSRPTGPWSRRSSSGRVPSCWRSTPRVRWR